MIAWRRLSGEWRAVRCVLGLAASNAACPLAGAEAVLACLIRSSAAISAWFRLVIESCAEVVALLIEKLKGSAVVAELGCCGLVAHGAAVACGVVLVCFNSPRGA